MSRPFFQSTAEDIIAAVEAVVANGRPSSTDFVAQFLDVPPDRADSALKMASELGFLYLKGETFSVRSPLSQFCATPNQMQKASALRIVLESYQPFVIFRERLKATEFASQAAQQTKVTLDLDGHRDIIKETLISLGTYSHALDTEGGGLYVSADAAAENHLLRLAQACKDAAAAEARIRLQIGDEATQIVDRSEVVVSLANALLKAASGDARGAVLLAGNAIESYLEGLASRKGVDVTGSPGINAKLERFATANAIPKKLLHVGKYLGHVRNAADHGIDTEINATWTIQESTGTEYVYVSCSFIHSITGAEKGHYSQI